jgi:type VI secretion system secreted protein VgrG
MSGFTQTDRPIKIDSPLGKDKLLVDRFEGEEAVSAPFEFRLRLRSREQAIDPSSLLGQSVTVTIDRADGSNAQRPFNGVVARFENLGQIDREYCLYTAVLRPWFWLLSHTADCRIFQRQGALDIVKAVFTEGGFGAHEVKVSSPPPPREYCVQYNESDLAFVSRLLEEEGIFYYFRHEAGRHVMVLGDDASALSDSAESRVSLKAKHGGQRGTDRLRTWAHGYELRPGKWAHTDYDFEAPASDLSAQAAAQGGVALMAKLEVFEYPGVHKTGDAGRRRAAVRAEQSVTGYDVVRGSSVVESFAPGTRFTVGEHHTPSEQGKRYVITEVRHVAQQSGAYAGTGEGDGNGEGAGEDRYVNYFVALPAEPKLRPLRRTPKPRMSGPQTALVVGPRGEEVWTDKYGRVKVQFYWDRYGKRDDSSSCWVRVAFPSAGSSWGLVAVPRVGYEVVVDYVDGDPDRPLVVGCVYNAQNMPPLSDAGKGSAPSDMPGAKMMTTLRSQSLGRTGGYNEITMNDRSGAESLFIKAQKDEVHKVGNDRETSIVKKDTLIVGADRDVKVTAKLSESAREIALTGQTKITLQCGSSKIELTPAMITINGPMVKIN